MSVDVFRAMQDNDTVSIRDLNEAKAGTGLNRTRSWHICKAVFSVLLSYAAIIIITSRRRAAATICPAPLLPLWAPKRLAPPSTPQRSSSFPRPIRSHAHRCSCLTR